MRNVQALILLAAVWGFPLTAVAQTAVTANEWSRGTTLSGVFGVASGGSRTGPALGGAAGWDLTPRVGLEGAGTWLAMGDGMRVFSGALKVRVRIFSPHRVSPFVQAGVGLSRASFSVSAISVPEFYRRRMPPAPLLGRSASFTDPTLVAGGGLNILLNRQLSIRPAVEATTVFRDGRRHFLTNVGVQAVFHFEHHPVTPSVRTIRSGAAR